MNYRIESTGYAKFFSTQKEAEDAAVAFCEKNSWYTRKGYPVTAIVTYNGVLVNTINIDGKC